ncbi:MAG: hypothetical protein ACOYEV_04935 [Candidatus Nanopelagicales bacterium]
MSLTILAPTFLVHAAADSDAATRPSPLSFYAFVFLAVALGLLLFSMSHHLRNAQRNLDPAATRPPTEGDVEPGGLDGPGDRSR